MIWCRRKATLIFLICSVILTGCWDEREIEDQSYVTSIGIDYEKNQYAIYVQVLDFSNVAKQEGARSRGEPGVWVGKALGSTLNSAFNNLYPTAQQQVFWGHVKAIVYSERALKHQPKEIVEIINRYREMRYDIWAYSTRESLEKVFTVIPFFKLSPLASILHEPVDTYNQRSVIEPVYHYRFIRELMEPPGTTLLPTLTIDPNRWKESQKPHSLLRVNGACLFHHGKYNGYLKEPNLIGLRWVSKKTERTFVLVKLNGKAAATVVILHPKPQITYRVTGNKPTFQIHVKAKGVLNEFLTDIPLQQLEKEVSSIIQKEIRDTYEKGLSIGVDVYHLEEKLYREDPNLWRKVKGNKDSFLQTGSLDEIGVDVSVDFTGKYKYIH
ncbi:Ger(x)C family spore germination protein [Brevibacillus ginsengisoli]|uniref:Ger(x)C family spore germination protein n=1 Tax=Brevibacillus ginsengisoli TaxID=363854 RepID=UPI003CFBAD75